MKNIDQRNVDLSSDHVKASDYNEKTGFVEEVWKMLLYISIYIYIYIILYIFIFTYVYFYICIFIDVY